MKQLLVMTMFALGSFLMANHVAAQVNVNVSIGNQPAWAPEGNDDAQYYYMPDMDMYYDVPAHQFVYLSNSRWVHAATLPAAYRNYDLYKVHKVALNQKNAYRNHRQDVQQYAQYKGQYDQHPIRDSHDDKYSANKNNWQNNRFTNNRQRGSGGRNQHNNGGDDHHKRD